MREPACEAHRGRVAWKRSYTSAFVNVKYHLTTSYDDIMQIASSKSFNGSRERGGRLESSIQTSLQRARKFNNAGNEYFKKKKYNQAIIQYSKAITIIDNCPRRKANINDRMVFYQNRAAANEQLKKYTDVKADCTKALELNPRYMKALLRRARASEQLGDLQAALDDLTTACIDEHFSNRAINVIADEILEKLVKQHVQENLANKKFTMPSKELVRKYFLAFPNDPILSRLQQPENIPDFFKKPLRALKNKKYDDIIPLCTEIIQGSEFDALPSSRLEVLLLRATFYLLLDKHDSAIQDFERILNDEDASVDVKTNVLVKRGDLYMDRENLEMAFKDFELAINMNPSCSEIYYHRGLAYWYMDRFYESKHDFEKAVEYNPNFCVGYMQKYYYDYCIRKKMYDYFITRGMHDFFDIDIPLIIFAEDIKRSFEKFQNFPECSYFYVLYSEIMICCREYEKADTYFVKAIQKDPDNAFIHVHRAMLQLEWKNDIDKTVELLNKALELDEKCDLAYEALGYIATKRGNLEEAIRLFDKALILCRTSRELMHIYYLREGAKLQLKVKNQSDIINIIELFSRFVINSLISSE
ncbi:PREDICTED: mitochondrial import receptor subunit TOM70-like [Wasmannia auropunctata]|uniref:mitochondrial import receptor subunit TOM70-like n=1 Tax=Wasmannia auropunctata TaxID=64793 RepID=UPI0005EF7FFA|nr:PREDICTED: mitochondrial import receptor subunit TOM70-like [Wasmannia auropunctata]